MINFIFLYFFTYILALCGYLLGNATKEEHKEIKPIIFRFSESFLIIFYLFSLKFLYGHNILLVILAILLLFFIIAKNALKLEDLKEFYYILILAISLIAYYKYNIENIHYVLLIIISMILDKSMKKFIFRKELYSIIMYGLVYFFYFLITMI